jgi:tetratricopeptide (TPR) repeat protein
MTPRLQKLLKMIDATPNDAFLLYGAALEHKNAGEFAESVAYLDRAIAADPGMCYAYYQKGQVLEEQGETDAAAGAYRAGLAVARRLGDAKAEGELSQALSIVE